MGVDFICLADSAAGNIFMNVGGHFQPPVILLEHVEGAKYATVSIGPIGMDG